MGFRRVLDFWFKENDRNWFVKNDDFDKKIKDEFLTLHSELNAGRHEAWEETPESMLAVIIVLDQFSRNMFRNDKKSFESDIRARALAKKAIQMGFDKKLKPIERVFLYLPFEHSENLQDQEESMKLFQDLKEEGKDFELFSDYADQHYKIIKRFNRFPHRNQILGRPSTPEEIQFLKEKGSSF